MYTAQTGLTSSRHTRLPSNASDVSTLSEFRTSDLVGQNLQRRVSSALISEAEADPIRRAIRATARTGPFVPDVHDDHSTSKPEEMSINEVVAAEEDVDVSHPFYPIIEYWALTMIACSGCGWRNQQDQTYTFE